MGICRPKGYGFGAVLAWNRVIDFAFLVWNRVWFWQRSMGPHMFIYFSCYFDIDQGHSSSKQIGKETKPRRRVIGLDNAIKGRFKWSEKGLKNNIFWSERGSEFWEPCGTPPIWRSKKSYWKLHTKWLALNTYLLQKPALGWPSLSHCGKLLVRMLNGAEFIMYCLFPWSLAGFMWTKTVIRDFLYYTIFPKPCLRNIAFTVKTKSTYHTSPTQATTSKHEATWGTLCTMGMKWCRDVMCQRLVQNSAWRHCSDRLTSTFLVFSRLGMTWASCYNKLLQHYSTDYWTDSENGKLFEICFVCLCLFFVFLFFYNRL